MMISLHVMNALITNDATVLGLLIATLALVFHCSSLPRFKGFFKIIPSLLLCYFLPAAYNSLGIVDGEASNLYFVASRYLLPASLVLLCLSIDLKGIWNLGPKALIMFFTATIGIVIGGPIALWAVSFIEPNVLGGDSPEAFWRGLSTVAGSWIGGGANQAALKEISQTLDDQFSAMLIVDVFVANLWMPFLLIGAGMSAVLDRKLKADSSAVDALKEKVEKFQLGIARIPSFQDLMIIGGIAFGAVALAHVAADGLGPAFKSWFGSILNANPDSVVQFLSSLEQGFFWIVVAATAIGIGLSFTKLRSYEGAGASKIGSAFLYVLVATIGMKMDVVELYHNWDVYWSVILIGLLWMAIHIITLLTVAKIIKAPFSLLLWDPKPMSAEPLQPRLWPVHSRQRLHRLVYCSLCSATRLELWVRLSAWN